MCKDYEHVCPFPHGDDVEFYRLGRSRKQWAWEFLRRNGQFIELCQQLERTSGAAARRELKAQILREFKLTRFKSFREDFDFGYEPLFTSRSVKVIENLTSEVARTDRELPALAYGHVWIRFRLADTLDDDDALNAMVSTARRMLRSRRLELLKAQGTLAPKASEGSGSGPKDNYGRHLRYLDLMHRGLTKGEALRQVNAASLNEPTRKSRGKKSELEQALKMPGKYLDVLYGRHRKGKLAKS